LNTAYVLTTKRAQDEQYKKLFSCALVIGRITTIRSLMEILRFWYYI